MSFYSFYVPIAHTAPYSLLLLLFLLCMLFLPLMRIAVYVTNIGTNNGVNMHYRIIKKNLVGPEKATLQAKVIPCRKGPHPNGNI